MKKYISAIVVLLLVASISLAEEGKKYGKEITLEEKTNISDILKNPDNFVGKKVLVEGTVLNVCAHRGCWMELSSDKEFESIKIKVDDGVIVFPMEAKGQKAIVEGEVYAIVVEKEAECSGDCAGEEGEDKKGEHKEGEHKDGEDKECEHKTVKETVYQIKGLGALIK